MLKTDLKDTKGTKESRCISYHPDAFRAKMAVPKNRGRSSRKPPRGGGWGLGYSEERKQNRAKAIQKFMISTASDRSNFSKSKILLREKV